MYNILCVDDTSANLLILEALFDEYKDKYNIFQANNGYKALEILLNNHIDLLLLDVMMPDIDGFETAKIIKQNRETKDIPIIFLTAKKDDNTIENAFALGVDYLSKPYNEVELISRVENHINLKVYHKKLDEQLLFSQAILDAQPNIVFVRDNEKILSINKAFLDFFHIDSLDDFRSQHQCVSELFMEYENFFSLSVLNEGKRWVVEIFHHKDKDYNVLLMDIGNFEPKAFRININKIDNTDKFVVTLTDITSITTKSKQFEVKATHDTLTGIYNRNKFNEYMQEYYQRFNRYKENICFAIFDIDFFKKVNDIYGHQIGDETLIIFAKTIDENIRVTDIFARWGGEEFTLIMPNTTIGNGFQVVDNLRKLIQNTRFKQIGHKTCSVGITFFKDGDVIESIVARADEALYEAKETGRNKVVVK